MEQQQNPRVTNINTHGGYFMKAFAPMTKYCQLYSPAFQS